MRFLWLAVTGFVAAGAWAAPKVSAESWILMDAETGTVLREVNADLRLPPASLTKIMSTYLYFDAIRDGVLDVDGEVVISRNAWAYNVVGSKMFVEVGATVAVGDLLRGVIVQSGNDASIALAEAIAGDEAAFAEGMNRRMEGWGLRNSRFVNSTGLPAEGHFSSARDIAEMVRRTILDFPELYRIYSEESFEYNGIRQDNRNGLLRKFAGADGVKTGYTKEAGYCLASSAERDGRRLIAVVMRAKSPRVREAESVKLLTYGFNQFETVRLFETGDVRELPVVRGELDSVQARPAEMGVFAVSRGAELSARFTPAMEELVAPIEVGAVLGTLAVLMDGVVEREVSVVAAQAVAEGGWWRQFTEHVRLNYLGQEHERAMLSEW